MKTFRLREICPDQQFAREVIMRYSSENEAQFAVEMPQWIYINEFEPPIWSNWWSDIYCKYSLIPGEQFIIIKE